MKNKFKILIALTMVCVVAIGAAIPANATVVYSDCVCGSEAWEYIDTPVGYGSCSLDTHLALHYTLYECSSCKGRLLELDYSREEPHDFSTVWTETIDGINYRVYGCPCGTTVCTPIA